MRLEKQVCSVELAKRLKELGVAQRGQYTWVWSSLVNEYQLSSRTSEQVELLRKAHPNSVELAEMEKKGWFSAFTVSELGEMLPNCYDTMRATGRNEAVRTNEWIGYDNSGEPMNLGNSYYTEADCRAALLISTISDKQDKIDNINQRLCQD